MIKKLLKKKTLLIASGLALALAFIIPTVYSSGPQFNYMEDDLKTIVAGNQTQGGDWQDNEVSAKPGDVISFQIYYHNGVENTVAKNTRVRADLPDQPSTKIRVNGFVWADKADIVTDSVAVNVNQPQNLEYVPGSTKWFPNRSQTGQSIGDGVTTVDGVNIGDITGCWRYAGFVTFRAKLSTPAEPEPVKSKSAFNVTQSKDATSTIARPDDIIEYRLTVENQGEADGSIVISDDISNVLKHSQISNKYGGTIDNTQTIFWPKDTVPAGESVTRKFRVKINSDLAANHTFYLENFYGNKVKVPARRDITIDPGMSLIKEVRNVSANQKNFVNQNTANPGDTLEYLIRVNNRGDIKLNNNTIADQLPAKANLIAGSVRYGYNQNPINNPTGDKLVNNGINFDDLFVGSQLNITFKAQVKDSLTPGTHKLVNKASNEASFESEIDSGTLTGHDSATTTVLVEEEPVEPEIDFTIDKKVKNITYPTNYQDQVGIHPGDKIAYRITLTNISEAKITDLRLVDVLPANTSLIEGSVKASLGDQTISISDDIVNEYVNLPNLKPSQEIVVTFKANTDKSLSGGSELVNVAKAKADDKEKSAKATIIVKEPKVEGVEETIEIKGPMPKTGNSIFWFAGILGLFGLTSYTAYRYGLIN
jgi:uncharacterized repeat protein (TIGR01451 family)